MTMRPRIFLAEIVLVAALIALIFFAWREDRRDRARLSAELAAAHQALAAADARVHDRDARLQQTLAAFAAQKRSVQTPAQILADLPRELPLPKPIFAEQKPLSGADSNGTGLPVYPQVRGACADHRDQKTANCAAPQQQVVVPSEDLKPLYDFTLDCKACQARLAAAQADLTDEKLKSATLAQERDAALRTAKGGRALRRVARAAKWFAIGAAAGALAARSAH